MFGAMVKVLSSASVIAKLRAISRSPPRILL
jgi:hypothetical protein